MDVTVRLSEEFSLALERFESSPAIRMLKEGRLRPDHYRAMLREIFHYSREDPQLQALASVYLRGEGRAMVARFLKHALSEIGHDQMALRDLATLGEDVTRVPSSHPLPATTAFTAHAFFVIQHRNPVAYLGYLYFLEHLPTRAGAGYLAALEAAGVPPRAMTFLREHMTVDVGHVKLVEHYLRKLVRTEADLAAVIYALQVTGHLYAEMLRGALESADDPVDYGTNLLEADPSSSRLVSTPVGA